MHFCVKIFQHYTSAHNRGQGTQSHTATSRAVGAQQSTRDTAPAAARARLRARRAAAVAAPTAAAAALPLPLPYAPTCATWVLQPRQQRRVLLSRAAQQSRLAKAPLPAAAKSPTQPRAHLRRRTRPPAPSPRTRVRQKGPPAQPALRAGRCAAAQKRLPGRSTCASALLLAAVPKGSTRPPKPRDRG